MAANQRHPPGPPIALSFAWSLPKQRLDCDLRHTGAAGTMSIVPGEMTEN